MINTIAFIVCKAYEYEGIKYYLEPILLVSDALITESIGNSMESSEEKQRYLVEEYRLLVEKHGYKKTYKKI